MTEDGGALHLAPFGNPDGSRADIAELLHSFVLFGDESVWGGAGNAAR